MAPSDLTDRSVLVLGGSGALGSRIGRLLADAGARVTLAGRDRAALERVAASIPGAAVAVFDLRDPAQASAPVDAAIDTFGSLGGVVNAAGVVAFGPLADMSPDALDDVIAVDLTGPLRVIRAAVTRMEEGFIVNLTGVVATMPTAGMAAYSAAKAGLAAATVALARELRRSGITVIDAQPPHTDTGLVDRAIEGAAPRLPEGADPDAVARRIVEGIAAGERVIPASAFSD
jgi:cyclic-di-GMP-binding biofilm dispersal mediator protein